MIQEYIPPRTNYLHVPRPENQGFLLSCTRFALTSALESLAAAAGESIQLSVRFLWYYTDKTKLSIESAVETINTIGTCLDSLCPYVVNPEAPYNIIDIDTPPSLAALLDAQSRKFDVQIEAIAGKTEIMRALAQGSRLMINSIPGQFAEHAEAAIGYDIDKGVHIQGSGNTNYWEPWVSFSNGIVTKVWAITKSPWPLIPHPDYIPESAPEFDGTTLKIPKGRVYKGWPTPSEHFINIKLRFSSFGTVKVNDPRVYGREVIYFESAARLSLPVVFVNGVRYERVSLTGSVVEHVSAEPAPPF
jgi:hypothetical protein